MRVAIKNMRQIFRNKTEEKKGFYPITDNSFLDVHQHYDKSDFIYAWDELLDSNRELWKKSLEESINGKKILIATLGGGFSHRPFMTMDAILSLALTLRGAKVESFFCDHTLPVCLKAEYAYIKPEVIHNSQISQTLCKGCYKDNHSVSLQLGLTNHTMSSFVTLKERQNAKEIANHTDFSAIKNYQMDGILIGKHAIAGAMRYFSHSDPSQLPLGIEITKRYLEASIISYYAVKRLLEENQYDSVCLTHGSYTPHGVIKDTCDKFGVPVTSWTVAYLKQRFIFSGGELLHSMLHEANAVWENIKWDNRHEKKIMDYLNSRWNGGKDWLSIPKENQKTSFVEFAKKQKLDLKKPIIGLLTNIIWEAYADYTSKVFPDMLIWIKKTMEYFATRKDLQLLIRIHPAEGKWHVSTQLALEEIKKMFQKLPSNVYIINSDENVSTYEAMEYCDAAIIYQTQTGLELAAQGIPVIVAGDAFIRNKGIACEPLSEDQYFEQLDLLPFNKRLSEDKILRARKYAYHAFYRKMIPLNFVEESNDWMLFKPKLNKLDELLPKIDEGLDIICDGILNGTPYIYPAEEYEQEGDD